MRGAQVKSFNRRAKYLLAEMQDKTGTPFTWLSHLGMTGRFMLSLPQAGNLEPGAYAHEVTAQTAQKHIHVEMRFDDGTHLSFADPRRFGFMDCFSGDMSGSSFLAALGPEPLGNDFNEATLRAAAMGARQMSTMAKTMPATGCLILCMTPLSPKRRLKIFCSTKMWLPVWAIYMSAKRSLWRVSAHADKRLIWGQSGLPVWCRPFAMYWHAPLKQAARPCAISPMRTVLWVISSTNLPSMAARAKPVQCLTVLLG